MGFIIVWYPDDFLFSMNILRIKLSKYIKSFFNNVSYHVIKERLYWAGERVSQLSQKARCVAQICHTSIASDRSDLWNNG